MPHPTHVHADSVHPTLPAGRACDTGFDPTLCTEGPGPGRLADRDTEHSINDVTQFGFEEEPTGALSNPEIRGFSIVGELGRGNMGVVYKARQLNLNRLVALKVIRGGRHAGREELQRFLNEARVIALVQHPHIVRIYDVGEQDGLPYFSMEYVEGGNLAEHLSGRPLPVREAAQVTKMLANAVGAAHQHGIIHRDLKPGNVLIRPIKSDIQPNNQPSQTTARESASSQKSRVEPVPTLIPVITDFGLAKHLGGTSDQTQSGVIMGTPNYMAPEQADGRSRHVGPAADIYALGAILYECITGRPPYNAESPAETILQMFQTEPIAPSRLQPRVPRDLETICLKCLQREPRKRYATAEALAIDLGRFLGGEPIAARPPSVPEQFVKWAQGRPVLATLMACLVLAVLAALAGGVWYQADLQEKLEAALYEQRLAQDAENAAKKSEYLTQLRSQVEGMISGAETALAAEDWSGAKMLLIRAREKANAQTALGSLLARADQLHQQVSRQETDRACFEQFEQLRNDALFNATLFTGSDLASSIQETRSAALQALALYGVTLDNSNLPALDSPHLSEQEKTAILNGCYEMLLVLADAEAQSVSGQSDYQMHDQALKALRILDRAALLGLDSQALHLRRASYLARAGETEKADREHELARELEPSSSLDYFLVGIDHYRQGQWKQASSHFQSALQLQANHYWSQYYLSLCRLKTGQPDLAVAELTACLASRPDFPWFYLLRGSAHTELGRYDAAAADFTRAAALPLDDSARYGLLINQGVLNIRRGDPSQAVKDLTAAIALRPQLYQGHVNLAQAFLARNKTGEALPHLDEAIRLEPGLAALYRLRAKVHQLRQDGAGALRDWNAAVENGGNEDPAIQAETYVERGKLLLQEKRFEEALSDCEAAQAETPQFAAAYRLQAAALLELGRYGESLAALDVCLKYAPPAADVYRARATVHARLGHYADALTDFTRAVDLEPDAATFCSRGWTYLVMDAPKLALSDFRNAARLDTFSSDAQTGLGFSLILLGEVKDGIAAVEKGLQHGPKTARLNYNAARAYAHACRSPRAAFSLKSEYEKRSLELLAQALELTPAPDRAVFWRNYPRVDTAFAPLRQSTAYLRLAYQYVMPGP
jgi:serine/threonine protein kinase/tetratricopeptide (TPR) repeat protein